MHANTPKTLLHHIKQLKKAEGTKYSFHLTSR